MQLVSDIYGLKKVAFTGQIRSDQPEHKDTRSHTGDGTGSKFEASLGRPVNRQWQQVERDSEQVEEGDGDEGRVRVEHVALSMEWCNSLSCFQWREHKRVIH